MTDNEAEILLSENQIYRAILGKIWRVICEEKMRTAAWSMISTALMPIAHELNEKYQKGNNP